MDQRHNFSRNGQTQQLIGTIPESIESLTQLQKLDLHSNKLSGTIPVGMGSLIQLEELDLSHNNLSGTTPESFGSLTKLRKLYLDNNKVLAEPQLVTVELGLKTLFTIMTLILGIVFWIWILCTRHNRRNTNEESVLRGKESIYAGSLPAPHIQRHTVVPALPVYMNTTGLSQTFLFLETLPPFSAVDMSNSENAIVMFNLLVSNDETKMINLRVSILLFMELILDGSYWSVFRDHCNATNMRYVVTAVIASLSLQADGEEISESVNGVVGYLTVFKDLWGVSSPAVLASASQVHLESVHLIQGEVVKSLRTRLINGAPGTAYRCLLFCVLRHPSVAFVNVTCLPEDIVRSSLLERDLPLPQAYDKVMQEETDPDEQDWGEGYVAQMVCDGWFTLRVAKDPKSARDKKVKGCWNIESNIKVSPRQGTHMSNKSGLIFKQLVHGSEDWNVLLVDTSCATYEQINGMLYLWLGKICLKVTSRVNKHGLAWAHPVARSRTSSDAGELASDFKIDAVLVAMMNPSLAVRPANTDIARVFNRYQFFPYIATIPRHANALVACNGAVIVPPPVYDDPFSEELDGRVRFLENPGPEEHSPQLLAISGVILFIHDRVPVFWASELLSCFDGVAGMTVIAGQCWQDTAIISVSGNRAREADVPPLERDGEIAALNAVSQELMHPGTLFMTRELAELLCGITNRHPTHPNLMELFDCRTPGDGRVYILWNGNPYVFYPEREGEDPEADPACLWHGYIIEDGFPNGEHSRPNLPEGMLGLLFHGITSTRCSLLMRS